MDQELKDRLADSLTHALVELQSLPPGSKQTAMRYTRTGQGTWTGKAEVIDFPHSFWSVGWNGLGAEIDPLLRQQHPDHVEMTGTASQGSCSLDGAVILRQLAVRLWDEFHSWTVSLQAIRERVQEVEEYFDSPSVRLKYIAPLINFKSDVTDEEYELQDGVYLRRLSEKEVSHLHGGYLSGNARGWMSGINEFALAGEFDETKVIGAGQPSFADFERLSASLNRTILAMRTFRSGSVGLEGVWMRPKGFAPVGAFAGRLSNEFVPLGAYTLNRADLDDFCRHLRLVSNDLDDSLELALDRLADSMKRTADRDRILDAVVGMEAILLCQMGPEEIRGESRYRFALHYGALGRDTEDRLDRYRQGRELYDLRSKIAHGGTIVTSGRSSPQFIRRHEGNVSEAAQRAQEILRELVARFLPEGSHPPYVRPEYWETTVLERFRPEGNAPDDV